MQHRDARNEAATSRDLRSGDRYGIALPITLEDGEGETHDISETGVFFETDAEHQVGDRISMTMEYFLDGREYHTRCEAQVVRVERVGRKVNVAARLLTPLHSAQ
jgi:hypothetical protein